MSHGSTSIRHVPLHPPSLKTIKLDSMPLGSSRYGSLLLATCSLAAAATDRNL